MKKLKLKWDKNYVATTVIAFIALVVLGYIIHGVILHDDYARNAEIYRAKNEYKDYVLNMLFGHLVIAASMVWLYRQGKNNKPYVGQGVRFGLGISGIAAIGSSFLEYTIHP